MNEDMKYMRAGLMWKKTYEDYVKACHKEPWVERCVWPGCDPRLFPNAYDRKPRPADVILSKERWENLHNKLRAEQDKHRVAVKDLYKACYPSLASLQDALEQDALEQDALEPKSFEFQP